MGHAVQDGEGNNEEVRLDGSQRVQVPNISGLWSQIPLKVWFWGPETLNIGYLDLLGMQNPEGPYAPYSRGVAQKHIAARVSGVKSEEPLRAGELAMTKQT